MTKTFSINKVIIVIFIFLIFFCNISPIFSLNLKKSFELKFENEISFFIVGNEIVIWDSDNHNLLVYLEDKLIKSITVPEGVGPGDYRVINSIAYVPGKIFIWDRMLRRFSIYNKSYEFITNHKFDKLGMATVLNIINNRYYFQINKFIKNKNGSDVIQNIGYVSNDNADIETVYSLKGRFQSNNQLTYDRPFLLCTSTGNTIYFANNQEYKIYSLDLINKKNTYKMVLEKKTNKLKWMNKYADLQWDVLKKPANIPKVNYPKNIHPIFALICDKDMIGVITNESLENKISSIDLYKNNRFIGKVEIPLIFMQHFLFPNVFGYPSGIDLFDNNIVALIYDKSKDIYKIIKWKIQL